MGDRVNRHVRVCGLYNSAVFKIERPVDSPPVTRTSPLFRSVAVCSVRAKIIDPVGANPWARAPRALAAIRTARGTRLRRNLEITDSSWASFCIGFDGARMAVASRYLQTLSRRVMVS